MAAPSASTPSSTVGGPKVTAVIVTYNSRGTVDQALIALRQSHSANLLRCVVVDNRSTDDTVEHVRAVHPWVSVVAVSANVGFGRGCNIGIEHASTPFVLLLNPDARLDARSVRELAEFLERTPLAAMAGPAIREGEAWQVAGGLPTPLSVLCGVLGVRRIDRRRRTIAPGASPFRTDWLCGSILMMRRAMLDDVGRFDPRFFLYFEETDLCRRALQRGWEVWAVGDASGEHSAGTSASAEQQPMHVGCIAEHYFQSRHYYLRKHHGLVWALVIGIAESAIVIVRAVLHRLSGRKSNRANVGMRLALMRCPARPRLTVEEVYASAKVGASPAHRTVAAACSEAGSPTLRISDSRMTECQDPSYWRRGTEQ